MQPGSSVTVAGQVYRTVNPQAGIAAAVRRAFAAHFPRTLIQLDRS